MIEYLSAVKILNVIDLKFRIILILGQLTRSRVPPSLSDSQHPNTEHKCSFRTPHPTTHTNPQHMFLQNISQRIKHTTYYTRPEHSLLLTCKPVVFIFSHQNSRCQQIFYIKVKYILPFSKRCILKYALIMLDSLPKRSIT